MVIQGLNHPTSRNSTTSMISDAHKRLGSMSAIRPLWETPRANCQKLPSMHAVRLIHCGTVSGILYLMYMGYHVKPKTQHTDSNIHLYLAIYLLYLQIILLLPSRISGTFLQGLPPGNETPSLCPESCRPLYLLVQIPRGTKR